MSSPQIIELGRRFEIGGHTRDHVPLTEMELPRAAAQICANKHWLEDRLGREVKGFAYVRGQHNGAVRDLVRQAGFHYARTVKNLMASPGTDPFQVPTTTQFYAHSFTTYCRNYLSGGPSPERTAVLANVVTGHGLLARCLSAAESCARHGGYFHLWGHSWELDEYDLWQELDYLLGHLRQLEARFVTNATWCASLTAAASTDTRAASEAIGFWPGRISSQANGSREVSR
jgi:peptidoglycan/xylan/chitin deacetylase (PgdA/CDA1 family)